MILQCITMVCAALVFSACLLLVRVVYLKISKKLFNYPPGPMGWPFLGIALQTDPDSSKYFMDLARNYDNNNTGVIMAYLFAVPVVVVHGHTLMKTTLRSNIHRDLFASYKTEIPFSNVLDMKQWRTRRKLIYQSFVSLMNSKQLSQIMEKAIDKHFFPILDKVSSSSSHLYCRSDLQWIQFSVLFAILYGVDATVPSKNDKDFNRFIQLNAADFNSFNYSFIIQSVPIKCLRDYLDFKFGAGAFYDAKVDILKKWHKMTQKDRTSDSNSFFAAISKHITNGTISYEKAVSDAVAVFGPGLHTTIASVEMALYYSAKYMKVQERVYDELKQHYLKYNGFYVQNMKELNIFRAFVHELIRLSSPTKTTLPRNTLHDSKINGYNIPKGTMIIGALCCIHLNKKFWKYPTKFYIEHFLDENNHFKRSEYFMPFGYGQRDCPGQALAMKMLFCYLSSILYRYKFSIPQDWTVNRFKIPDQIFMTTNNQLPLNVLRRY